MSTIEQTVGPHAVVITVAATAPVNVSDAELGNIVRPLIEARVREEAARKTKHDALSFETKTLLDAMRKAAVWNGLTPWFEPRETAKSWVWDHDGRKLCVVKAARKDGGHRYTLSEGGKFVETGVIHFSPTRWHGFHDTNVSSSAASAWAWLSSECR